MIPPADIALILLWGGFFAYWGITGLKNRTPVKQALGRYRFLTKMAFPVGIFLFAVTLIAPGPLAYRLLPDTVPYILAGLALAVLGIAFAIWARVHLGTNWSSQPAIRENHTIIRTGPYAIVRHPIYAGILAGILGTAIATGVLMAFLCIPVILLLFLFKSRMEEKYLIGEFGDEYEQYRRGTKALVPWIF